MVKGFRTTLLGRAALGLALCAAAGGARAARAQDAEQGGAEKPRQIKYSAFSKKRPAPSRPPKAPKPAAREDDSGDTAAWNEYGVVTVEPAPRPSPKPSGGAKPGTSARPPRNSQGSLRDVGVTIWRLRPARENDTGPGFSVTQGGGRITLIPERIDGNARVSLGDRVRISIESPSNGYLYVINRERYSDGSVGPPALIFPVTSIRGGDNRVYAGRLVDIPDSADEHPFFTLTTKQSDKRAQTDGEIITILITPRPLAGVRPGRYPILLGPEQVARWEAAADDKVVQRLEMSGGVGRTWTAAEKKAGEGTRSLTQIDPTPQTIYRLNGVRNRPVLVTVRLLYGTPSAAPSGP